MAMLFCLLAAVAVGAAAVVVEEVGPRLGGLGTIAWAFSAFLLWPDEKMMNTERELTEAELDAVSGGAGKHIADATIETFGESTTGGGATPASAWNACLGVFGYLPQA